jgi:hypothetical protein
MDIENQGLEQAERRIDDSEKKFRQVKRARKP